MPIQQMMLGSGASTDPVYIDDIFGINLWDSHTDRNEIIASGVKLGNANILSLNLDDHIITTSVSLLNSSLCS